MAEQAEELQIQAQKPVDRVLSKQQIRLLTARELLLAEEDIVSFAGSVKTHDPHRKGNTIVSFPAHKVYLQRLLKMAQLVPKLAVYKSRQMMITWSMSIVCLHHGLFIPGRYVALISKKEEDAGKIIGRIKIIHDYLPLHWRVFLPEIEYYKGKKGVLVKMVIHHPNGQPPSIIQAYPQGGDQTRMETFSLVYWDEVGFCDDIEARKTYTSLRPTLEGGGRLLMSSTPPYNHEHFWEQIVSGRYFE
jgi:hypothetical protein